MKTLTRGLLIVFSSLVLTMTGCKTAPVTPLVENQTPSLSNTKWHYMDGDWEYNIEFLSNGLMRTQHPNDGTPNNDSWEQKGETVLFYFNDRYSRYRGKFVGKDIISGTATSQTGAKWEWKIQRLPK